MVKGTIEDIPSQKGVLEPFGEMVLPRKLIVMVMVKDFHGGKSVVNGPEKNVLLKVIFDNRKELCSIAYSAT